MKKNVCKECIFFKVYKSLMPCIECKRIAKDHFEKECDKQ